MKIVTAPLQRMFVGPPRLRVIQVIRSIRVIIYDNRGPHDMIRSVGLLSFEVY